MPKCDFNKVANQTPNMGCFAKIADLRIHLRLIFTK